MTSMAQAGMLDGVIAIGGASGAALAAPALQALPLGVPKVLVSPVVSGETSSYVGTSDVIMIPPVVDFSGMNVVCGARADTAAATLAELVKVGQPYPDARTHTIGVTVFGVTSPLVNLLAQRLNPTGLRQVVFSCNGIGGRAYERFLEERRVFGAFDLTTSELADELFGGVLSAGPTRLTTASRLRIPQVVLPGALDFMNFGSLKTVPEHLRGRPIIQHTPEVTLVRTSVEENDRLGRVMAQRLMAGGGDFTVIVPLQGFSLVSEPGKPFHDPEADHAFLTALREELGEAPIVTVDAPLNSEETAAAILEASEPWRPRLS